MIKKSFIILLTIITVFITAGCRENTGFMDAETPAETETVTSNEISIPIEKIRSLNPLVSKDEETYYLHKLIYEGLFALNKNLEPVGALAESYKYQEDGASVEIYLKSGIMWHDGQAFSAEDVKFSIDAYLSVLKSGKSMYGHYISKIKSAKVIGENIVLITFVNPLDAAVENLTFPIIPKHLYKKPSDVQKDVQGFIPVGTGPYKVDSIDEGEQIILTGNVNYSGAVPENKLKIVIMPGKEEAVNLFEIREINMSFLKKMDRDTLLNDKDVNVISFPSNEVEVIGYNFKHGALQDRRVRQAIAYAIDNQAIIETCYYNSGVMNDSIYYPDYFGIDSSDALYEYNLDMAEFLLERSGSEGLTLSLLVNGDDHARNLAAQMVKMELEKIGISVSLIPLSWEDYNTALAAGEFDLYIGGFQIGDIYDTRSILHGNFNNLIGFSNERLNSLLDSMQSAVNTEQKREIYSEIHKLLRDEIPYYCILYKTYGIAASADVKGEIDPMLHNIYNGCETWSLEYEIKRGTGDE